MANRRVPLLVLTVTFAPMPSRFDRVPTVFTRSMSFWFPLSLRSNRAEPVVGGNQQIQITVIVEISIGRAAAHNRSLQLRGRVSWLLLQTCSCPGCGKDAAVEHT